MFVFVSLFVFTLDEHLYFDENGKEKQHVSNLNLLSVVCRKEDKLKMQ